MFPLFCKLFQEILLIRQKVLYIIKEALEIRGQLKVKGWRRV
jgi:hypothetical protein